MVLVVRQRLQLRLPRHPRRAVAPVEYNFRSRPSTSGRGVDCYVEAGSRRVAGHELLPARSATDVFHTYSRYARGAEWTGGSYDFLDLTALGRQEEWEEPKGRAEAARAARPTSRPDARSSARARG